MNEDGTSIIVFDVETTGTRKDHDQVIELSVQKGLGDDAPRETWRIKPSVPISPGAQAVHGITMDDLADAPPFSTYAPEFHQLFENADVLVGYNVSFDLDMMQAEFHRAGLSPIDVAAKLVIDPYRLWQQRETRKLQDAHRRFVGTEFEEAHSAEADIAATARVLNAMLKEFGLKDESWESIADICEPERRNWIGTSQHFQWQDGVPVIAFGKHGGTPIHELAAGPDSSYLHWMMGKDFPEHVKRICEGAVHYRGEKLVEWLVSEFGPPPEDPEPS